MSRRPRMTDAEIEQWALANGGTMGPKATFLTTEATAATATPSKRSKYGAKRTTVDGITFPSQREAARYLVLKLRQQAGEIRDLELQPRFDLIINGKKCGRYTADFRYVEVATGDVVIEEVKGYRVRDYVLRKKVAEALYGISVREV